MAGGCGNPPLRWIAFTCVTNDTNRGPVIQPMAGDTGVAPSGMTARFEAIYTGRFLRRPM